MNDLFEEAGEAVVLLGNEILMLSPTATRTLGLLQDGWVEMDVIARELVRSFGEPPGDPAARLNTRSILVTLSRQGIIDLLDD